MPKVATARLHVFLRIVELFLNLVGMGVLFGSALWLFDLMEEREKYAMAVPDDDDDSVIALIIISLLLVTVYNFYNQLLVNIRFCVKMKCVTCGLCIFDGLNYLFCWPCFGKACLLNNSKGSIIKWLMILVVAVVTEFYVEEKNERINWEFDWLYEPRDAVRSNFGVYMILFALQPLIFRVFHVIFIIIFGALTCCC